MTTQRAELENRLYINLLPILLAGLVYVNSLGGDFVHDDLSAVRYNQDVTTTADAGIWSNDFWGMALSDAKSHKSYRPLTVLSFRWNYLIGGLNPFGYHVVNVVLHSVVTFLFARLCRQRLETTQRTSLFSAGLFAIHSVHTEAVAGIVGRADILATLFFLLSFWLYHRLMDGQERASLQCLACWASSVILAWASLTAKEHGIAALPVALLFDVATCHVKSPGKNVPGIRIVATIIAVVLITLWRLSILNGELPTFSDQDNPLALCRHLLSRALSLLYLPAVNMGLLLAPVTLSYDWQTGSVPAIITWSDTRNFASLFFYVSLVLVVCVGLVRANRIVIWSTLVMIIPMVPCSNLFYTVGFVVAERLLYLPSLGFCLLVGHGLDNLMIFLNGDVDLRARIGKAKRFRTEAVWRKRMKRLIVISTLLTSASMLTKTLCRNTEWSSRSTLFSSGLRTMPHNAKIHYNYANLQRDLGDWDQAVFHYRRAIQMLRYRLWPNYSSAHNNLGTILLGRSAAPATDIERNRLVDQAETHFREALNVHITHVHARYNLAVINICHRDDLDQAESLLMDCLALDPEHKPAKKLVDWLSRRHRPIIGPKSQHKVNKTGSVGHDRNWPSRPSITMSDLSLVLLGN